MNGRRIGLVGLVGGIVFVAGLAVAAPAFAGGADKFDICHFAGQHYNAMPVSADQITKPNGHGHHPDDIIPPFDYDGGHFDGLNWTPAGQVIWNKGLCNGDASQGPPTSSSSSSSTDESTSSSSSTDDSTSSSSQSTDESTSNSSSSSDQTPPPASSSDDGTTTTSAPDQGTASVLGDAIVMTKSPAGSTQVDAPAPIEQPGGVDHLARTGSGVAKPMTAVGVLMIGLGTGLVVAATRRRRAHAQP